MSLQRARINLIRPGSLVDILVLIVLVLVVYALIGVAHEWSGPFRPKTEISLSFGSLIHYASLSLFRVIAAYLFSLMFTIGYGYLAAKSRRAEPVLISLLDILQSIPVLGFMPGLVIGLVYLFPNSNLGLELAAVIMIFTGQAWNMVFSFYSSLKNVPTEWTDLAQLLKLSKFEMLKRIELPFAANGLLWNSMLSVAGGWFFLMVIESFTLGEKDFRLPGIGSYMAVAYERGDFFAIFAGIVSMFVLIILVDRCLWAPLVVWSERFRVDSDSEDSVSDSVVFEWARHSRLLAKLRGGVAWLKERFRHGDDEVLTKPKRLGSFLFFSRHWTAIRVILWVFFWTLLLCVSVFGIKSMYHLVSATNAMTWLIQLRNTFLTFVRVVIAVVLGSLWTIPLGVFIGVHPAWTRRFQPVVQIVASFPAPMLFPMIAFAMVKMGLSLDFGSIILLLLSSQWYILFNVISGASLIPQQLLEVSQIFRVNGRQYWKAIILPAIFPSLLNGWITAAGGSWNACIVAEWVQSGEKIIQATGIGSSISDAAHAADFPALACGVITLVVTVVLINRFFWGGLYHLAETRFKLEFDQ